MRGPGARDRVYRVKGVDRLMWAKLGVATCVVQGGWQVSIARWAEVKGCKAQGRRDVTGVLAYVAW